VALLQLAILVLVAGVVLVLRSGRGEEQHELDHGHHWAMVRSGRQR